MKPQAAERVSSFAETAWLDVVYWPLKRHLEPSHAVAEEIDSVPEHPA